MGIGARFQRLADLVANPLDGVRFDVQIIEQGLPAPLALLEQQGRVVAICEAQIRLEHQPGHYMGEHQAEEEASRTE